MGSKLSEEGETLGEIGEDFSGVGRDLKGLMEFRNMVEMGTENGTGAKGGRLQERMGRRDWCRQRGWKDGCGGESRAFLGGMGVAGPVGEP